MFESLNIFQLVAKGGYTIIALIVCSIISITVIIQKYSMFRGIKDMTKKDIDMIKSAVAANEFDKAKLIAEKSGTFLGRVLYEALKSSTRDGMKEAIERAVSTEAMSLEEYLPAVGTIGNIAPFIGLLGTVIGIMRAFHDLGKYGMGNPSVISTGISESLVATASGLFVAIPSVIFYNYFARRINRFVITVENSATEILEPAIYKKQTP